MAPLSFFVSLITEKEKTRKRRGKLSLSDESNRYVHFQAWNTCERGAGLYGELAETPGKIDE
jgi:hypothetical protein